MIRSDIQVTQLLIKTGRSDKSVLRIILLNVVMTHAVRKKSNMRPKFFLQTSDHQQSTSAAPSRGHILRTLALLVVADLRNQHSLKGIARIHRRTNIPDKEGFALRANKHPVTGIMAGCR